MKAKLKRSIQHHEEGTLFHYSQGVFISGNTAFMVEDVLSDDGECFHLEEFEKFGNLQSNPEENFYEELLKALSPRPIAKAYTA